MAEKNYPISESIQVEYMTDGAKSGETVVMEIFDETGAKDGTNFPDVTMTERGTTGVYDGSFTPDAQGEWLVLCSYGSGKGKVIKKYSVGAYNVDSVGQAVANLNNISTAEVNAEVDQALADYDVAKASDITTPPQIA